MHFIACLVVLLGGINLLVGAIPAALGILSGIGVSIMTTVTIYTTVDCGCSGNTVVSSCASADVPEHSVIDSSLSKSTQISLPTNTEVVHGPSSVISDVGGSTQDTISSALPVTVSASESVSITGTRTFTVTSTSFTTVTLANGEVLVTPVGTSPVSPDVSPIVTQVFTPVTTAEKTEDHNVTWVEVTRIVYPVTELPPPASSLSISTSTHSSDADLGWNRSYTKATTFRTSTSGTSKIYATLTSGPGNTWTVPIVIIDKGTTTETHAEINPTGKPATLFIPPPVDLHLSTWTVDGSEVVSASASTRTHPFTGFPEEALSTTGGTTSIFSLPVPTDAVSNTGFCLDSPSLRSKCDAQDEIRIDFEDADENLSPDSYKRFGEYFEVGPGFKAVRQPELPFIPDSGEIALFFNASNEANIAAAAGTDRTAATGEIGPATFFNNKCSWRFNANGAAFGCIASHGNCDWELTAYRVAGMLEGPVVTYFAGRFTMSTKACAPGKVCAMKQQDFYMQQVFDDISYFHVNVTHKGVPTNWYLDDLRVDWTDNSCEAGRCREHHRFGSFGGGLGEGIWCL